MNIKQIISHLLNDQYISHCTYSDWGCSVLIMHVKGIAFARLYWYYDDDKTMYLSSLSVDEEFRNKKIGTELQLLREIIAKHLNARSTSLKVDINSWMYEWYKRRGYKDWKIDEEPGKMWMIKNL